MPRNTDSVHYKYPTIMSRPPPHGKYSKITDLRPGSYSRPRSIEQGRKYSNENNELSVTQPLLIVDYNTQPTRDQCHPFA